MYDWPELRPATDAVWAALRAALRENGLAAPDSLERGRPRAAQWRDPDLLLSQTCGYPFATALRGAVRLVATPVYRAEGCDGPAYRSAVVVRVDDPADDVAELHGRIAAFNSVDSQSGYSALRATVAAMARNGRFFSATVETGAHRDSMRAVAQGRADCAAIDCVCWALAGRHQPDLAGRLRVIAWSGPAPALPFVTAAGRSDGDVAALRDALTSVLADPAVQDARAALLLRGVEVLDDAAYGAILAMEREAVAAGYARLA